MRKISKNRMREYYRIWKSGGQGTLGDCYKNASTAKWRAWAACKESAGEKYAWSMRVLGHNSSFFTVGYLAENGLFVVKTAYGTYSMAIEEEW